MELNLLLNDTWNFFRNNFLGICKVVFVLVIPLNVLNFTLSFLLDDSLYFEKIEMLLSFLQLAIYPLYQCALILYIASVVSGDKLKTFQYYRMAANFWLPLLIVYFIYILFIFIGLFFLIIPGVVIAVRIAFAEFHCIFEKQSPMDACFSSWAATKPYQWIIFKGILTCFLIFFIPLFLLKMTLNQYELWNTVIAIIFEWVEVVFGTLSTIFLFRVYTKITDEK